MKVKFNFLKLIMILALTGCGMRFVITLPPPDKTEYPCAETVINCEECLIQPRSGPTKILVPGFYYDLNAKKCKKIMYSPGGIPPPFSSIEECKDCCCY